MDLPLTDDRLAEENIWKLGESVNEYRRTVDNLNSANEQLSRENSRLKRLCSNIGSLWDLLNRDVETVVASACIDRNNDPSSCAESLVDTLLATKLPLVVKEAAVEENGDSRCLVIETDDPGTRLEPKSQPADTKQSIDVNHDTFVLEHMEEFNNKKTKLLTHVKHLEETLREYAQGRYHSDTEPDIHQQLDAARFKDNVLELSTRLLCDSLTEVRSELEDTIGKCNKLEVEVSRLTKLNADLRYQLCMAKSDLASAQAAASTTPDSTLGAQNSFSTDGGSSVKQVERIEEVTTRMIIGSSLYNRLYEQAKKLDEEVDRLEKENSSLRMIVESSAQANDDKTVEMFYSYEDTFKELSKRVEEYEERLPPLEQTIVKLNLKVDQLSADLEIATRERDQALEELQLRDRRLQQVLEASVKLGYQIGDPSSGTTEDPAVADKQEQIQSLAQELDEISSAFEEKIRFSEGLLEQLKEARDYRDKYSATAASLRDLEDKHQRMIKVYEKRISALKSKVDESDSRVESYRQTWLACFERATHYESQRNIAMSAMCESQALYRRYLREKKELLMHLTRIRSQASVSVGSASGELNQETDSDLLNVMQENDVLRRRMTCTVCCENFRDQCITLCGHVFCKDCLTNNITSRNRKCPVCKVTFDKKDLLRVYLE